MVWTEWYLLLVVFPLTILFLLVKDWLRLAQVSARQSRRRTRKRAT